MNHIYRLVWNASKQAYCAVTETAKGRGKSGGKAATTPALIAHAAFTVFIAACAIPAGASGINALPTGGQVTAGAAAISSTANTLTVQQSTQKVAINWQSFSVGSGATVNFVQPNASSVILNRVVGNEQSVIAGAMNANGQVFLLNSNGVLFTGTSSVNVGGLVASTLNMSDADFMAGRNTFSASSSKASVINLGTINAADGGYVALLGNQVKNEGVITAKLGTAIMAAGDQVSLNFNGNSLVGVTIDQGTLNALVENKQAIRADGGLVVLTAKGLDAVMATVVNNTGEVRAQTVANREGKIYLLGGMDNNRIEVGGTLDASAPNGGNGGFVETSAARLKFTDGVQITTAAANGAAGKWLIDPLDFTIAASGGDITGAALGTLLASTSIQVETATSPTASANNLVGSAGANGDIFVNDSILKTSGGNTTLTLKADKSISLAANQGISSTGGQLNVYFSADNSGTHVGDITLATGSRITTNGGNIVLGGAIVTGLPGNDRQANITLTGTTAAGVTLDAGAGGVSLYAKNLTLSHYSDITAQNILADTATTTAPTRADGLQIKATDSLTVSATGIISLNGRYSAPTASAIISPSTQSLLRAGNSISLTGNAISGNSIYLDGMAVQLRGNGSNTLSMTSANTMRFIDSSFAFTGTPILNFATMQATNQSAVTAINGAYSSLDSYLAGTSQSLFDFATARSFLSSRGSHWGLSGGAYTLKVYGDTPTQTIAPKSLDNEKLALGTGLENSVNSLGNVQQPFYYNPELDRWLKLTYRDYPMDMAFGIGGATSIGWNNTGTILDSQSGSLGSALSGLTTNTSGLANGKGTIEAQYNVTSGGYTFRVTNTYSLDQGASFIRVVSGIANTGVSSLDNTRFWVGTRDDFIAVSDANVKTKGNILGGVFTPIATQNEQAKSIVISEDSFASLNGTAVVFHSTNLDADTVTDRCCRFSNVFNKDPRISATATAKEDGSYAIFMNHGDIAVNQAKNVTWYYGAAPLSQINSLVTQVGAAVTADSAVPAAIADLTPLINSAINPRGTNFVTFGVAPDQTNTPNASRFSNVLTPLPSVSASFGPTERFAVIASPGANKPTQAVTLSQARSMMQSPGQGGGGGVSDGERDLRVPVSRNSLAEIVNGGVRLPAGLEQELFVVPAD